MKKSILVLGLALCACFGLAQEAEKVSLGIGALKVVDLPFVMQNYRISSPDIVKLENFSEKQLRIIGQKQGTCELEVIGAGMTKRFSVTVVDNIRQVYDKLRVDLDTLPELDISINQDYIAIKGEISSIKNWEHLQKVLPMYEGMCKNYATFRPAPEMILNMKKLLEQSGYVVSETPIPTEPGKIGFQYAQNVITVTGSVYHPADLASIKSLFSTQNWIATEGIATDGKVRLVTNLKVEPTMIDVGTVYVGVTKSEGEKLGSPNNSYFGFNPTALYDIVTGKGSGSAVMSVGLNSMIQFMAETGVTRFKTAGHLTFISNNESKKEATFHNGGTMYIRVSGQNTGDLKEVQYGLQMTVSGGLTSGNKVKLDIAIERSDPPQLNTAGDYGQRKSKISTSVICEMNKTVVLGGLKDLVEGTSKAGLPILRNTPILQWFVSESGNAQSDMQLLILISPRVQTNDTQIKIPPSALTADTLDKADKTNKQRIDEEKRFHGFWVWLNWFCW
jgi:Flp pilus assembly secretin CpaC